MKCKNKIVMCFRYDIPINIILAKNIAKFNLLRFFKENYKTMQKIIELNK